MTIAQQGDRIQALEARNAQLENMLILARQLSHALENEYLSDFARVSYALVRGGLLGTQAADINRQAGEGE